MLYWLRDLWPELGLQLLVSLSPSQELNHHLLAHLLRGLLHLYERSYNKITEGSWLPSTSWQIGIGTWSHTALLNLFCPGGLADFQMEAAHRIHLWVCRCWAEDNHRWHLITNKIERRFAGELTSQGWRSWSLPTKAFLKGDILQRFMQGSSWTTDLDLRCEYFPVP